jgi:hypothetical protein
MLAYFFLWYVMLAVHESFTALCRCPGQHVLSRQCVWGCAFHAWSCHYCHPPLVIAGEDSSPLPP